MNKKSLLYSGVLLFALLFAALLLQQGVIQSAVENPTINLSLDDSEYLLGQPIEFTSQVNTFDQDPTTVQLVVSGPEPFTCNLPIAAGSYVLTSNECSTFPGGVLDLVVQLVLTSLPGGTLPPGTLPGGGTLPKGVSLATTRTFILTWFPPINLSAPPSFALLTNGLTENKFPIPQLQTETGPGGIVLPNTELVFTIPTVGAPTGTVLPGANFAFNIPTVSASSNASSTVPDLPDTSGAALHGFNIPDLVALGLVASAPTSTATFPDTSAAFNIPDLVALGLVASAPGGVPTLPTIANAFNVPGGAVPRGMAADGNDFWIVVDADPFDKILKVNSSGATTTAGIVGPGTNLEGVAFLNGFLWVVENQFRCGDLIEPTTCERQHRVFKVDPASPPSSGESAWAALTRIRGPNTFAEIGDIASEGSGPTGSLWLANKTGGQFYNISASGSELSSPFLDRFVNGEDAIAFKDNTLFTASGGTITQWTKDGKFINEFSTNASNIRGMAFSSGVLHLGTGAGVVSKTFVPVNVTNDPLGIAFSPSTAAVGRALWILVDAEPKDKLLKVNPDTGLLISSFGTNGFVDAPSGGTEGITFLSPNLWVVANENFTPKLFKVNASTGAVEQTFDLSLQTTAQIFGELGDITDDGTSLFVHEKNGNGVTVLSTVNAKKTGLEQVFPCCPANFGARGFAFNTGRKAFLAGKSAKVAAYNSSLAFVQDFDLTQTGGSINGIQGMTFDGDTLYIAHTGSGKVSRSFLAKTVTNKPRGLAFSASTSGPGEALWILVDAEPFDKLLKVDPETGLLISTFGTSGFVDGPSKDTEGITYFDTGTASTSFLWAIANESFTRKLYKINATTGAVSSTFDLSSFVFNDLGGLTNDGINLVAYAKDSNQMFVIDTAGAKVEESFPCCTQSFTSFGAKSVAFHSGRKQFFAAKNQNLLTIDSTRTLIAQERTLTLNGTTFPGSVEGMTFSGDVLYVGRTEAGAGKVSIGALRKSVTNSPRGLALSPTGSILAGTSIGRALWVLVDGDPKDLVLKLDPDASGSLITSFDAPNSKTDGITFLANHLWIVAEEGFDRKLFKVNPVTGATVSTFNLSGFPGGFVFDTIGDVTDDGTNLLLFTKDFNHLFKVDTSGAKVSDTNPCCPQTQGATGVAFRTANNQLLAANGAKIVQYVLQGNQFTSTDEFDLTATLSGIQGMTLDPVGAGADDDVLYIAHTGSGKISKTGIPSDTTNSPRGVAYDAGANELFILVDGKAKDRIVVVNPAPTGSPTVIRSFPAPSNNAESITFLNGSLFVGIHNQEGCCPPPPPEIVKLNPTTGAEIARLNVGQALNQSKATGLSNNGQFLIAVAEFGGEVVFIDPADGSQESRTFFFDPQNPQFFVDGLQGLAFQTSTKEFFPVKGTKVFRFASEGRKIEEFTVATQNVSQLRGATFVGNLLYLAEGNGKTIQRAGIPVPQVTITTDPRAMATDGDHLFVVVDASPVDKIMKLIKTNGALATGFGTGGAADAPGNETEGLAFHKGFLYAVTNDVRTIEGPFGGFFQQTLPLIHKLATTTGAELSKSEIFIQTASQGGGPPPAPQRFIDPIGALASDGQFLYAAVKGTQQVTLQEVTGLWLRFDPDSSGTPAQVVAEFPGVLAFMPGFESFEITKGPQFPANRQLLASGHTGGGLNNVIARFDRVTGAMFDQFVLSGGRDVTGMAYIGITLFMADDATNSIIGTQLPENTTEVSLIGSYTGRASVVAAAGSSQTGLVPFTIVKNPSVVVKLTNPTADFVLTSVDTTVAGLVNDPAATTADISIKLPFTAVVNDEVSASSGNLWNVNNQLGGAAVWHVACDNASPGFPSVPRLSSPHCSWRYGIPGGPSFDTGNQTAGVLSLKTPVEVTQGMQLRFFTGYITEVVPEADRKFILVATVSTDLQGNDVVGDFKPFARIVGKGFGGAAPPAEALPGFRNIEVEPLFITPNLVNVSVNLSQFAGSRIKVAFKFDSVNKFANQGEGWYLDGINIEGASVGRVTVNTTLLSSPQVVGGVEFHRSFSTPFTLAEGSIDVLRAEARQPYAPFLSGFDQISGFVDSQAPVLTLTGIPGNTNQSAQTLLGTVADITFDSLDVTHTTSLGSQVIFGIGSLPTNGAFSLPVSLVEGLNTFTAVARDKGNASSTKQLLAVLDTAAPTVRDDGTIFPVGAVSARPGDEVIFQVTADDGAGAVSGVKKVELVIGGQVQEQLLRASNIPAIVREQFGIKGQWVLFETVPTGLPPGEFEVRLRATDNAGNTSETPVTGEVTASLLAMNIFLFDGANLVGVNLQASPGPDFNIENVLAQLLDTSELEPSFEEGVRNNLGNTSSTASVLGKSAIPVLGTTGFQAGDRVVIGSGPAGSSLAANSFPNASSIKVVSTSGFAVGDTIAVTSELAPFGLGFTRPVTTTVASIVDSQTLALGVPLAENHFVGEKVSRSQGARVTAVDSVAKTITIDRKVIVGPSSTSVQVREEPKLGDVISAIFHFTGGLSVGLGSDQGVFQQFIPGVGGDLTALKQGRGYWFIAKPSAFARSAPLPGFTKGPIIPVRMQLDGILFDAAGSPPSLPATVELSKPGWHQIAAISEKDRVVERGARGLLFPIRKFTSLVEFQKFIGFNSSTGVVEVLGGVFNPLFAGDLANPGDLMKIARGFYMFLVVAGTHTP